MGSCSCSQTRGSCCYSQERRSSRARESDVLLENDGVDLDDLAASKHKGDNGFDELLFSEKSLSSIPPIQFSRPRSSEQLAKDDKSPNGFTGATMKAVTCSASGDLSNSTQACSIIPDFSETQPVMLNTLIASGKIDDAKRLIDSCQDINVEDGRRCTPLQTAIICNQQDIARVLVERRANLGGVDSNGQSPLHLAATRGHVEIASLLVGGGLGVNARDTRSGRSPLHFAARVCNSNVAMITFLLEKRAEINAVDERHKLTPLHEAVSSGCLVRVELLCQSKASISTSDASGRGVLHKAASAGGTEIAALLIDSQASVDEKDCKFGYTPLHLAVIGGHKEVSHVLLQKGARRDAKTNNGRIPIHFAKNRNDAELTQLLERRFFACACVR